MSRGDAQGSPAAPKTPERRTYGRCCPAGRRQRALKWIERRAPGWRGRRQWPTEYLRLHAPAWGIYFYDGEAAEPGIGDPLGPKAFPRLLGIGLLITASFSFLNPACAQDRVRCAKIRTLRPAQHVSHRRWRRGLDVLYFLVFEKLGYVIATAIFLLALMAFFHAAMGFQRAYLGAVLCDQLLACSQVARRQSRARDTAL